MARRKRSKRFGSPPEEHRSRMKKAHEKLSENIDRAIDLAYHGSCNLAAGALATAEYWRGRGDAEAEAAGERGTHRGAGIGDAYTAVSKCRRK